jgi:Protein-only RNase P/Pentacotripeptide-repeat region of PRORP
MTMNAEVGVNEDTVNGGSSTGAVDRKRSVENICEASLAHHDVAVPPAIHDGTMAKRTKRKHTDPAVLALRSGIQQCCKRNDLKTAMTLYDRAIDANTRIEPQSFYSLLNLCDGLGAASSSIHIGTPQPRKGDVIAQNDVTAEQQQPAVNENDPKATTVIDDDTRRQFAERVQRQMDLLHLPLTETAYTALVRLYCRLTDVAQAERIIGLAEATVQCKVKLRLYAPLLLLYCETGRLYEAVSIWWRLSQRGLSLTEVEYRALVQCCTQTGHAAVLARVLADISEDVLVPSHDTTRSIVAWFQSPHAVVQSLEQQQRTRLAQHQEDATTRDQTVELLARIKVPHEQTAAPTFDPIVCEEEWIVSPRCEVDVSTGRLLSGCLEGATLEATSLPDDAWNEMKRMNETIAVTGKLSPDDSTDFQGGGKGRKIAIDAAAVAQRQAHWDAFVAYLAVRSANRPVNVVIDGANVGYFEKNFAGAPPHVDYEQIDWVVQYFLRHNQSVLLVMHSRHFARHFMPSEADPLVRRWTETEPGGILFRTPPGMNDDWFWLHAALHFGPGTLVVTNDEMRDHHFQMVAPRSFLRWRDRHQIHFAFGGWQKDERGRPMGREVKLTYPDAYSRRIQRVLDGFVIPLPKRGDTHRFLDGAFVAEMEPEEEAYTCIRPAARSSHSVS